MEKPDPLTELTYLADGAGGTVAVVDTAPAGRPAAGK